MTTRTASSMTTDTTTTDRCRVCANTHTLALSWTTAGVD